MEWTYHCAARRNGKPSRISAEAAAYKRCRVKRGGRACKFSYMLEKGEREDGVDVARGGLSASP